MLNDSATRERYDRYLDFQAGIFSKAFWVLLAKDEKRAALFAGAVLAVIGGIVGITLSGGIAIPAVAVIVGGACGALIGTGSGIIKYDMSVKAAVDGVSFKDMCKSVVPSGIAGGVAGALTIGLGPLLNAGLEAAIGTGLPQIVSLTSAASQYAVYQITAVSLEGAVGDRWRGYGVKDGAADLGYNLAFALLVGTSLGFAADVASSMVVEELAFAAMTATEVTVDTVSDVMAERVSKTDVTGPANEARSGSNVLAILWRNTPGARRRRRKFLWTSKGEVIGENEESMPMLEYASISDYETKTRSDQWDACSEKELDVNVKDVNQWDVSNATVDKWDNNNNTGFDSNPGCLLLKG